ncbi:PAS domain S-box protein [Fictibacillus sp. 18YEL24]|uniref:PAS domain S-box protein n=1 Tax=Fictibacillus sp. 18YEL24 TaxID=2745875 RepID=UPI0018CD0179|nr:PAS domain S-box protein [Fictibacillus sp. 18YEL24]MBH0168982.1 PAS domain S-box protein [Fictibacillus sp. 18YEL24]
MVHNASAITENEKDMWRSSPFPTGLSRQKSMTFRCMKHNGELIMTESEGELFDLFGLKRENVLQKRIEDIFPKEMAAFKKEMYERALNGESLTYESELNGIPFLAAIGPIYNKDGTVSEVYGFCVDLTERVSVETQLAESEQRFRSLMDHNIDALFSLDLEGKFTTVNKACAELSGYSETELLNMTFNPFMMPDRRAAAIDQFKDALKGHSKMYETRIQQKNGGTRQIMFTLTPIIVLNKVLGVFGIAKDVTAKREAEKELRETKDLLEAVIYHSSDAISVVHLTDYSVKVNPAFEFIYGWSQDELTNLTSHILPVVPEDKAAESERLMTIVKHGGYVKGVETIRLTKSGKRLNVSLSLSPIYGENGEVVALSAISRDITDKKLKEKALKESEEKYRIIAENTTDLVGVVDLEGNVKYVSPSNRLLLGFDPSLYDGKKIQGFFHSDDRAKVRMAMNEMVQTQKPVKFEVRCKHAHGHWVTLEANATPIANDSDQPDSFVVVARDLTERKKTEEMLRKSDKLSVLGQLAAGVAHEIRNPLTSIRGFLQLLQSRASENEDYYEIMLSEIDRINSIVGEFMLLAKPQAMNFVQTDLRQLLRHVISILDTQAILTNVQIYFENEPDLPEIWCVDNQIKQVFVNMLKNAIEAMPTGGSVHIHLKKEGGYVIASFIDHGCGISEERLPTLGEPFYTTKEKGTGLGLMICYKIVENHHGKILINSKIDEGTTFSILLPIDKNKPVS